MPMGIIATTTFASGSAPDSVAVSGQYAYVAEGLKDALAVVDISNLLAPVQRAIAHPAIEPTSFLERETADVDT